jgi:hypothetical protein
MGLKFSGEIAPRQGILLFKCYVAESSCIYSAEARHQGRQTIKCNSRLDKRPPFHITLESPLQPPY